MINIVVNQNAINNGTPCNPDECPLAIAIERSIGQKTSVGLDIVTLWNDDKTVRLGFYYLPKEAAEFRKRFDRGEHVHPFTFKLANKITKRNKELVESA